MPIAVPTSPAKMRDALSGLCKTYRSRPPTGDELTAINALISAFFTANPSYSQRKNLKRDSIRKLALVAQLIDDGAWPMHTNTALTNAITSYFGSVPLGRLTGSNTAAGFTPVTPPGPVVSYWNGTDATMSQLFATQWGWTGSVPSSQSGTFLTTTGNAGCINGLEIIFDRSGGTNILTPSSPRTLYFATDQNSGWVTFTVLTDGLGIIPTLVGTLMGPWYVYSVVVPSGRVVTNFWTQNLSNPFFRIYNGSPL